MARLRATEEPGRPIVPSTSRSWLSALRPHQWAKNALIVLPALAAHVAGDSRIWGRLALGLAVFCLISSAIYLVNDVLDLPYDRQHPTKRRRAIAAGEITRAAALRAAVGLAVAGMLLAAALPESFRVALLAYIVLTLAYSLVLKRMALVDVMVLAALYTVRIIAGAALASVPLSEWFLAFAIFLFLSLALVKRVVELTSIGLTDASAIPGRGYASTDVSVLTALGLGAAVASALVYVQYVTGSEVQHLYRYPAVLLGGLPLELYWISRIWLLTHRQVMHEDPVVFALRDPASYATLAAFLLVVLAAA